MPDVSSVDYNVAKNYDAETDVASVTSTVRHLCLLYYKLAKFKNFKLYRATGPVFGTGRPKDSVSILYLRYGG